MRVRRVYFKASIEEAVRVLSQVFGSLPRPGEENAWQSQEAMQAYCDNFDSERADCGGYYLPYVPERVDDGVVCVITPSSDRPVTRQGNRWVVDFGPEGSEEAVNYLATKLNEAEIEWNLDPVGEPPLWLERFEKELHQGCKIPLKR